MESAGLDYWWIKMPTDIDANRIGRGKLKQEESYPCRRGVNLLPQG